MSADQVWQILTTVGAVAVVIGGATWALSTALGSNTKAIADVKTEMVAIRSDVRADVALLKTAIDGKFALLEERTRAEIEALKLSDDRAQQMISELQRRRSVAKKAAPARRAS